MNAALASTGIVPTEPVSQARPAAGPRNPSVVHVITALGIGGAERHVELLARASTTAGRDVHVLVLQPGGSITTALRATGVSVEEFSGGEPAGAIGRLSLVFRLAARLAELAPDVVHVHLLSAQLHGLPAARLAGVPVVVSSEHSLMATEIEGQPLGAALRLTYLFLERCADVTVAVSAETRRRLLALGVRPHRIRVVENAVDLEGFAFDPVAREQVRAEWGVSRDERVVLSAGRLEPQKRTGVVLAGMRELLDAGTRLVVLGDGREREELEASVADLGDRVSFLGARDDFSRLLHAADVFVTASRSETFGMAVVEAAAGGMPVVFGECPGLDRLVVAGEDPEAARWFRLAELSEDGDQRDQEVEVFRARVREVLDRPVRRTAPAVGLVAAYGPDRLVAELADVYRSVGAGTSTRRSWLRSVLRTAVRRAGRGLRTR